MLTMVCAKVLLDAAWVRSRAERPSVSYTKVRASNSLARRIEKVESKMCVCPPARRTRSTEVMKKGGMRGNTTNK